MSTTPTAGKNKKLLIIGIAVVAASAGILLIVKFFRKSKTSQLLNLPDAMPETPASKPAKASSPSTFPLKNGSPKSNLVSQLQALLGVNADGLFGPKTEAALLLKTGKRQIANQTEYDAVITTLQNAGVISSNKARVNDLVGKWNANSALQLFTLKNTDVIGVTQDAYGALHANGKSMTLLANKKYNRTDYTPVGPTVSGFLILRINTGKDAGLYKADVTKLSVV
jgi:hypothetical protein